MRKPLILLLLLTADSGYSQPTNDVAGHIRWGLNLPPTCRYQTGDIFFKTGASGRGPYACTAANTWAAMTGASGSSAFDTITSGTNTTATMTLGTGGILTFSGSGQVNASHINGVALGATTATSANLLIANGTSWVTQAVSGDMTIGNTGIVAIGAGKVTNAMLAGSIAASKLVGTDIATVGTITAGTWSATTVALNKGGTGQTTQQAAFDALAPTATRAGDVTYWDGTHYVNLAGNNAGTKVLQETSSGVPSWVTGGAGNVTTSVTLTADCPILGNGGVDLICGTFASGIGIVSHAVTLDNTVVGLLAGTQTFTGVKTFPSIVITEGTPSITLNKVTISSTSHGLNIGDGSNADAYYWTDGTPCTGSQALIGHATASKTACTTVGGSSANNIMVINGPGGTPSAMTLTNGVGLPLSGLTGATVNRLLWASATNTISDLATGNNGVLITSGGGVPSISSTLPSGIAATSMVLTTPSLGAATATSLLASGIVDGKAPVTLTTGATATLGAGTYQSGYTLNQESTAGTGVTYTLPATAVGIQQCVKNSDVTGTARTGVLTVAVPTSSYLHLNGVRGTISSNITSGGAAGDAACFVAIDATNWEVYVQVGTWTLH